MLTWCNTNHCCHPKTSSFLIVIIQHRYHPTFSSSNIIIIQHQPHANPHYPALSSSNIAIIQHFHHHLLPLSINVIWYLHQPPLSSINTIMFACISIYRATSALIMKATPAEFHCQCLGQWTCYRRHDIVMTVITDTLRPLIRWRWWRPGGVIGSVVTMAPGVAGIWYPLSIQLSTIYKINPTL